MVRRGLRLWWQLTSSKETPNQNQRCQVPIRELRLTRLVKNRFIGRGNELSESIFNSVRRTTKNREQLGSQRTTKALQTCILLTLI